MLEDNYNDIIKKARQGRGMSLRSLSDKVGGVRVRRIVAAEEGRGWVSQGLAGGLGLSYNKLHQIYQNKYMPAKISEKIGQKLILKKFKVEVAQWPANAYILINNAKEALLIDSVGASELALLFIKDELLKPVALLVTHGHFDHTGGMEKAKNLWPEINIKKAGKDIQKDGLISVAGFQIKALKTPGHSHDSVCYLIDDKIMFTGDTVFAGSIGKPNYNYQALLQNIKEKILSLPDKTILCPGHGPITTVSQEKKNNPFF
jgi:glyoxylase-like metal-dependent hydrolase (beta-lactamase superfamily II)